MASAGLVRGSGLSYSDDADGLIASLLFPIFDYERSALVARWLRPRREPRGMIL